MAHLEDNHILSDAQYGFEKIRRCKTQLLFPIEDLSKTSGQEKTS